MEPCDEGVGVLKELMGVFHVFLSSGNERMIVIDVSFVRVDVDGVPFQGTSDAGADNIDDAGLGDDLIIETEGIRRAVVSQQSVVQPMIGSKQKIPIHRS